MEKITQKSRVLHRLDVKQSILFLCVICMSVFSGHSQTFSYTGSVQSVTLNPGSYEIEAWGADGGKGFQTSSINNEGKGGYSKGILTVTTPTLLPLAIR